MYTDFKLIAFTSDKINLIHFVKSQHSSVILAAHFSYKFKQNTCSFKGTAEKCTLAFLSTHPYNFFSRLENWKNMCSLNCKYW